MNHFLFLNQAWRVGAIWICVFTASAGLASGDSLAQSVAETAPGNPLALAPGAPGQQRLNPIGGNLERPSGSPQPVVLLTVGAF